MPASKAGALPLGDAPTRIFALRVITNNHQLGRPYNVSQNERNRRFKLNPLDPAMRVWRYTTLNVDQLGAQFLGDLPGAACANCKAAFR